MPCDDAHDFADALGVCGIDADLFARSCTGDYAIAGYSAIGGLQEVNPGEGSGTSGCAVHIYAKRSMYGTLCNEGCRRALQRVLLRGIVGKFAYKV